MTSATHNGQGLYLIGYHVRTRKVKEKETPQSFAIKKCNLDVLMNKKV